jgi:hypothetical protein
MAKEVLNALSQLLPPPSVSRRRYLREEEAHKLAAVVRINDRFIHHETPNAPFDILT